MELQKAIEASRQQSNIGGSTDGDIELQRALQMSIQTAANGGVGGGTASGSTIVIDGVTISAEDRAVNEAVMKCKIYLIYFTF